jgi:hypothetical protein
MSQQCRGQIPADELLIREIEEQEHEQHEQQQQQQQQYGNGHEQQEEEQEEEQQEYEYNEPIKKPSMCKISKHGLTLFGWNISWIVIIIIIIALGWYMNKEGMFGDKISSIKRTVSNTSRPDVEMRRPSSFARNQTGGFKSSSALFSSPGEVRKIFNH